MNQFQTQNEPIEDRNVIQLNNITLNDIQITSKQDFQEREDVVQSFQSDEQSIEQVNSNQSVSNQLNTSHISYRPDIDGLRAVAVIIVVIFHAYPESMTGGFIGVDIFFVISGYLITSIINKEIVNNKFSFIQFYSRRIKRIYPALIIILTFIIFMQIYGPFQFKARIVMKTMAASTIFGANIQILTYQKDYFDPQINTSPLLHLWSLGVEQQFYIIWPLLLVLIIRKLKISKKNNLFILSSICLLSFLTNVWTVYQSTALAYYSPFCRFWQLGIGGIAAYSQIQIKHKLLADILSSISLITIMTFVWILDGDSLFPGWWALIPSLGAVFSIIATQKSYFNKLILSNPLLNFVGKISYPLYLWHWPLFIMARQLQKKQIDTLFVKIQTMILTAFILSLLTYFLVQNKIRYKKSKLVPSILFIIMLGIGIISFNMYLNDVKSQNNESEINQDQINTEQQFLQNKSMTQISYDINQKMKKESTLNIKNQHNQKQISKNAEQQFQKNKNKFQQQRKNNNNQIKTQLQYLPGPDDVYYKDGRLMINSSKNKRNRKLPNKQQIKFSSQIARWQIIFTKVTQKSKYFRNQIPKMEKFQVLNQGKNNQLFIIGDSHAGLISRRFKQLYLQSQNKKGQNSQKNLLTVNEKTFPTILSMVTYGLPYYSCNPLFDFSLKLIEDHMPNKVFILNRWTHHLQYTEGNDKKIETKSCYHGNRQELAYRQSWKDIVSDVEELKQRLIKIKSMGIQVFISTLQIEQLSFIGQNMLYGSTVRKQYIKPIKRSEWRQKNIKKIQLFENAVKQANATLIDFSDHSCWEDICQPLIYSGYPIMRDLDHFANYYSRYWASTVDFIAQF